MLLKNAVAVDSNWQYIMVKPYENRSCVFLDRDGVLNKDRPDYVYRPEHLTIFAEVPDSLKRLKKAGFLLIVITNQSGISKGIYTISDVQKCHDALQQQCGNVIDGFYFSPYHPSVTASLSRKPNTLLFERAIAQFALHAPSSWMIGDRQRDLIPARKLGMKTIHISEKNNLESGADYVAGNLQQASLYILDGLCSNGFLS